jgi:hypothetical protein
MLYTASVGGVEDVLSQHRGYAFRRLLAMAVHSARASVGTAAPKFALPDAHGESIALDDLLARGPVVLVFLRGFA